jgi:hypothetical protein
MTLALNKVILMILLVILLILLGITGVYGGYLLILDQPGIPLAVSGLSDFSRLLLGLVIVLVLGILPVVAALQLIMKHKKNIYRPGRTSHARSA